MMASPWKFLVRLVSPRRLEKQDGGAIKDGKPDVAAMAEPTETPVKENVKLADQPSHSYAMLSPPGDNEAFREIGVESRKAEGSGSYPTRRRLQILDGCRAARPTGTPAFGNQAAECLPLS